MPAAAFVLAATFVLCIPVAAAQDPPPQQPSSSGNPPERIVTVEEVKRATEPRALLPVRILSAPHRFISAGLEKGLIQVEKHRMRERLRLWTEALHQRGVTAEFGGLGEGVGVGAGGTYAVRAGAHGTVQFLGRASFKGYQEFGALSSNRLGNNLLELEASYQWRPQENFYGLGHGSRRTEHTSFALRQSWIGGHWQIAPVKRLRVGAEYKTASLSSHDGQNPRYASSGKFFPDLPGFGTGLRLQSIGGYLDADLFQGEYLWGALAHVGASYQDGFSDSRLQYFRYETQLEGRMPVARGRSVLIAQGSAELTRTRPGSDPVPFYLLPHIGGSSTLRGFTLDRFYGRNLVLATFEYRYRIHPNIQAYYFFDEGQIFDHTRDLRWLNWHRNYGLGFKMSTARSTFLRIESGRSREGWTLHISFGDLVRRPLGGPIRYGTYRR